MPRNYIGSTTLNRHNKGYYGSVTSKKYGKIWKEELRANPHLFKCHIIEKLECTRSHIYEREQWWQKRYKAAENSMFINLSYAKMGFYMDESVIEQIKITHNNKSKEEIEKSTQKQLITKSKKSVEEKIQRIEKLKSKAKRQWENMSDIEKEARSKQTKIQNQNRLPETNELISNKITVIMNNRTKKEWDTIKIKKKNTWEKRKQNNIKRKSPEKLLCNNCGLYITPSNFSRHKFKCL